MSTLNIIIPTLNAANFLESCLASIKKQNFTDYQILIVDGGSTDQTLAIAKKFKAKVLPNPLKTAEAAKAIGVRASKSDYVALIDSDNILPDKSWLKTNLDILKSDSSLVGSEPIKFTYRPQSGFIERYSALIGANDPYAFITGLYDRYSYLSGTWTGLKIEHIDKGKYLKVKLESNTLLPTIGANGTIFKTKFLQDNLDSDYLFDIDILSHYLQTHQSPLYFAKVKQGIIHTFCESSIKKFYRKQNRRITDYFYYQKLRHFDWSSSNRFGVIKFILYVLPLFPMLYDTLKGFIRKTDMAWFFHPLACYLTLYLYTLNTFKKRLNLLKEVNRQQWQQ